MDSTPINSQSDDGCINQHHEMECTDFNIIEVNAIINANNIDKPSEINQYKYLRGDLSKESKPENADKSKMNHENDNTEEDGPNITTPCQELKIMAKLAIPVCITSMARIGMWNIDQIFLGHLGTPQLAGASLSDNAMEMLTSFVYTPACSLNGLCSQAIGSGNKIMSGYWLQLTIIICSIFCIPVSIGYFYISDLINAVSDDDSIVLYSKEFAHYAVLFLWTNAMLATIRSFHQSLEIVNPFTIISIIAILLNILGNQLWIYGLNITIFGWKLNFEGLGFIGSPLATSTSMLLQLILYYIWCYKIKKYYLKYETWNGWSLKKTIFNTKRLKEYGKVVVPLIISNASENWGYQVVIMYAAKLDAAEIATMSCTFCIWGILWSFYSGVGAAIVTRVGKKIGNQDVEQAKMVSKIGFCLSIFVCLLTAISIFLMRDKLSMIYSDDPEVHKLMRETITLLCVSYFAGGIGWCAMKILEGMSRNKSKGIINVITAWFGYVPGCVYIMTGDNHKILNVSPVSCIFMIGIIVEILRAMALWCIVFCTDWKKACIEAQKRNDTYDDISNNEEIIIEDNKECKTDIEDNDDGNVLKYGLLNPSHTDAASSV